MNVDKLIERKYMNKYPGYRTMTSSQRYNAKMDMIWENAKQQQQLVTDYRKYSNAYSLAHDYSNPLKYDDWLKAGKPND